MAAVVECSVVSEDVEKAIVAVLAAGARELELFDDQSPPMLAALFWDASPEDARANVENAFRDAGIRPNAIDVRPFLQLESSEFWCPRPVRFGPLAIVPEGRAVPRDAERVLIIEAADAFGSG